MQFCCCEAIICSTMQSSFSWNIVFRLAPEQNYKKSDIILENKAHLWWYYHGLVIQRHISKKSLNNVADAQNFAVKGGLPREFKDVCVLSYEKTRKSRNPMMAETAIHQWDKRFWIAKMYFETFKDIKKQIQWIIPNLWRGRGDYEESINSFVL